MTQLWSPRSKVCCWGSQLPSLYCVENKEADWWMILTRVILLTSPPCHGAVDPSPDHSSSPVRDIGAAAMCSNVLTIGPRGIFAAIYENKNMERIIYKRAQKVYPLCHDYNELDHISSAGLNINKYSSEQRTYGPGPWKYVSPCCQNRPFCKINSLTRAIKWFTVTIIMRKLPLDHEKCKAWIMNGLANNIQYCEYQFKDHYEY